MLRSLNPADVLLHLADGSDNLLHACTDSVRALAQFFLDRRSKEGARTGVASELRDGVNPFIDGFGKSDRSSRHSVPPPSKGMKRGPWDTTGTKKEGVRRVADEDMEVADE